MSLEVWLLLQALAIVKMAVTIGLSGLALVPAIRLMREKPRAKR